MNRRVMGAIAAGVLAVVGTLVILAYVRDADDRAQADIEMVEVYVVDDRVAAGSGEADLRGAVDVAMVQASTVVSGVVTDVAELEGKVAAIDLVPGEQLLRSRLVDEAAYQDGRSRLTSVPEGLHEVTVSLAPERALGGQVVPGDTVSVLASFDPFDVNVVDPDAPVGDGTTDPAIVAGLSGGPKTPNTTHIIQHKVLVTRVQVEQLPQEETDSEGNPVPAGVLAPTGNLLVTLAMDAAEAERLVFSPEFGYVWLTYEPLEASEDGTGIQTRGSIYSDPIDVEVAPVADEVSS